MEALRKLPDSELRVMQAVWHSPAPAERKAIEADLGEEHAMALTTLLTLLGRLAEKGYLEIRKEGRRSVYLPLVSEAEYQAAQSGSFFRKLFGGNVPAFAAALCDSGLSAEEIEELRRLLKENAE